MQLTWPHARKARLVLSGLVLLLTSVSVLAFEPIKPIPRQVAYNEVKAQLGKRLFFEPLLSLDETVTCASCHDFASGGADPRVVSLGVYNRKGDINAPTVLNSRFNFRQFWNGRAKDLKEQASGPLHSPQEMAMDPTKVEERLNKHPEYPALFRHAYPNTEKIVFDQVVDAIAEFESALYTPDSKFDQYLRGEGTLNPEEKAGYILFKSIGCITCHNGINVGGNSFQYLGVVNPVEGVKPGGDVYALTGDPFDKNRYKVPSLRNIELTAPYLHDGSKKTLADVLDVMAHHNLGFRLSREENNKLSAFLLTLTGKTPAILANP